MTEVNAWSAPVQENTSSSTSGRSTLGSIACTAARSSSRGGRFGLRLQGREVQTAVVVEDDLRIVRDSGGDLPVGAVQQRGPRRQVPARLPG